MSSTEQVIPLNIQPPRKISLKKRLARNLRNKGHTKEYIKRIVWHPDNSPTKRKTNALPNNRT